MLYQIEVKLSLVRTFFHPAHGWRVTVDLEPMELGKSKQQSDEKRQRAEHAYAELGSLGVKIGPHDVWGRVDVVADHPDQDPRLIEVEGGGDS